MSSMNNIKTRVREYLVENVTYGVPIEGDDINLVHEGMLDSFGSFDLAVFMQGEFSVEIPPTEINMENFGTLNSIERYIVSKQTGELKQVA